MHALYMYIFSKRTCFSILAGSNELTSTGQLALPYSWLDGELIEAQRLHMYKCMYISIHIYRSLVVR